MSIVTDLKGKPSIFVRYTILQSRFWEGEDGMFFKKKKEIVCRARKIRGKDIKPKITGRDVKLIRNIFKEVSTAEIISISVGKGSTRIFLTLSEPMKDTNIHGQIYPVLKKHAKGYPLYGIAFKNENFQTH